ncbi:hypothetical protein RCL_jg24567.t1 [Rhizophagus clarus]|uniref:Uncharacterized protein n=1 Tax=Rhizophagus clarus TaxID=94130 RepID=A0A8H3R621_9GLOM|nr:hypothetical protein RCL_jg24567.t1 [Rhizophagus clarus]
MNRELLISKILEKTISSYYRGVGVKAIQYRRFKVYLEKLTYIIISFKLFYESHPPLPSDSKNTIRFDVETDKGIVYDSNYKFNMDHIEKSGYK